MTFSYTYFCPLCSNSPMQLTGNPHGEQYYRCMKPKCYGARDVEGASFREEPAFATPRARSCAQTSPAARRTFAERRRRRNSILTGFQVSRVSFKTP